MFRTIVRWVLPAVAATLLAGCGGGEDSTKARLRFVNASAYTALDVYVDDERRFGSVAYAGNDNYVEIDPDQTDTEVRRVNSGTALVTTTPALNKDNDYTLVAYGREGALKTVLLDENEGNADSGKTKLRVLNAAPDAGALDVYITGSDEALTDAVPLQSGAAVGTLNGYSTLNTGTRRLRVTASGSKTDVRLDIASFALNSEQVATLVLTPTSGGTLVSALRLVKRGGIGRNDTPQARVRVAAALPSGSNMAVTVGGIAVLPTAGTPVVGNYTLVTAADAGAPVITVNGTAISTTASALTAGADYTLLVYGSASAPTVAWLSDDNHLPTDTTQAKVRLVHGVADVTGTISLDIDLLPVAGGVAQGAASAYSLVPAASATAAVSVTAGGTGTALVDVTDQTFKAGANYTLFVLGNAADKKWTLRQDR